MKNNTKIKLARHNISINNQVLAQQVKRVELREKTPKFQTQAPRCISRFEPFFLHPCLHRNEGFPLHFSYNKLSDPTRSRATRARKLYRGHNLNKLQQHKVIMNFSTSQMLNKHNPTNVE